MRAGPLFAIVLLSACTYETADSLKSEPGKTHTVKSARPASDYADCVKQRMDAVRYGAFADRYPATRTQRAGYIQIASAFYRPGFGMFNLSGYAYMYSVDVAEDGASSVATGYVHPFFEAAGEVWSAMDRCIARE